MTAGSRYEEAASVVDTRHELLCLSGQNCLRGPREEANSRSSMCPLPLDVGIPIYRIMVIAAPYDAKALQSGNLIFGRPS